MKSRRPAREAALRALYELEIGQGDREEVLESSIADVDLEADQAEYVKRLVRGFFSHQSDIDNRLAKLIRDYDFDRISAIDRNVLRLAAYELLGEPALPPAVTINEAIEIVKKYSTAESGRFVNGVLGNFLKSTEKVNWNPATAPPELMEEPSPDPAVETIEETVQEGSDEAATALRFGEKRAAWTVKGGS